MLFVFAAIGIMTCCYIIFYVLVSIKCLENPDNRFNFLLYILVPILIICALLSAPIQPLVKYHDRQKEKEFKQKYIHSVAAK